MIRRYKTDEVQKKKKEYMTRRYNTDALVQSKKKEYMVRRYSTNALVRSKKKEYMVKRYSTDTVFQRKMKVYMVRRYSTDSLFQRKRKENIVRRYSTDSLFQRKMKEYMVRKYAGDPEFRAHHILRCTLRKTQKCVGDATYHVLNRLQCALRIKNKYKPYIRYNQETPQPLVSKAMETAIHVFRCKIQKGSTHICTVCHRALFPDQVKVFPEERRQEWICHTCDNHLKQGNMSSIAAANKLELPPIPAELVELNVLERQLISKIIPFAKIVTLPQGQQRAVHGAVVCVPSEVEMTVSSLPRPSSESQLLQVKLKRHVKFKGYQHFHTVNMHNALAALSKLKEIHSEYRDIAIRETAIFDSHLDEEADDTEKHQKVAVAEQDKQQVSVEEKDELRPGLRIDTSIQPPDIGQEILSYGEGIFSIAPAQGQTPVGFFKIPKLEAMAFPVQFPTGQNTIDEARQIAISPSVLCDFIDRYISCQLPNSMADPELHQIVTEVQLHSRNHSKSCKKGNLLCRFGFPKLPMSSTTITRPQPQRPEEEDDPDTSSSGSCMFPSKNAIAHSRPQCPEEDKGRNQKDRKKSKQEAAQKAMSEDRLKLKPVWDLLNDPQASFDSLSELLTKCNLTKKDYEENVEALSTANVILLKCDPKESWVNGHNPDLLRAWNANMDIQFVLDPFNCIMYMLSYISKPEHEMNDVLKNVVKGVRERNVNEEDEAFMEHCVYTD
ncbi:hypothetical protein QQF64_036143 [Cirrhinus molitorella]|uniref:DUF6570 domain-containing protein n=1 Tax=Cirrhinus molitorella TaxID=172907 RepID=A0ABR3NIT6_9TELE